MRTHRDDVMPPPGWKRIHSDVHGGETWRPEGDDFGSAKLRRASSPKPKPNPNRKTPDQWASIQQGFWDYCTLDMRKGIADKLGLKWVVLSVLGLGWSKEHKSWSFPMYGADMKVRGIRLRAPGGKKFAVLGSQEGVFRTLNELTLKSEAPATKTVYVAEGPTDTAALLQLGFTAVGRPSCTGAVNILVSILKELRVVIVTDADSPGRSGACILAGKLKGLVESVKIIEPHRKDMREWVTAGATSEAVEMRVHDAKEYRHGP